MVILGGNMRFKAMKEAKWKEIPVEVVDWDEAKQREFIIKDNVGFGEWDWDDLANNWDAEELDAWGLDVPVGFTEEPEAEEDDYVMPDEIQTDIVLGDLFEIGEHRLLCGDSTDSDAVAKLMDGQKADMIFTDPPYNGELGKGGGFKNDLSLRKSKDKLMHSISHLYDFNPDDVLKNIEIIKKDKCSIFLFCNKNLVPNYLNYALQTERKFDILTWHKESTLPLNNNTYRPDTEFLIKIKDKGSLFNVGLGNEVNYGRFWLFNSPNDDRKTLHPTVKPQKIINDCIKISSNIQNLIIDLFLGSGSTMVAAHQLNRKCYGMELEPKYCQVIVDRMLKLDPTLQIKRNGQPYLTEVSN
jgi:DNA modification methylase